MGHSLGVDRRIAHLVGLRELREVDAFVEVRGDRLDLPAEPEEHADRGQCRGEGARGEGVVFPFRVAAATSPLPELVDVAARQVVHVVDRFVLAPFEKRPQVALLAVLGPLGRLVPQGFEVEVDRLGGGERFEIVGHGHRL